jgi:hypothetical protein
VKVGVGEGGCFIAPGVTKCKCVIASGLLVGLLIGMVDMYERDEEGR